ncbi:MAG: virion core protein [Lachnospiraceae bacterium]|nr:virion core protein [Lachnospiraceae bacterium]
MGIIKAAASAVKGALADSWLEVYEADDLGDQVVFTKGVCTRQGQNKKKSTDTVSNGSVIHVAPNQFMMLTDGGKVIDYTAEEGYYEVSDSSLPSLLNGEFKDTLNDIFDRIRFGGQTPSKQKVYFINLQEIKGIKFGTRNPVNYFDNFYNAELFLRAHGTYSIKITNPLKFYAEVIPKNDDHVTVSEINEQYLNEFLEALQSALNQMSADGIRISHVTSKSRELGGYMAHVLDGDWNQNRGMEIQSVGIASVSYDEESKTLIHLRNQGAMLSDASVREGYVQGALARGMEAAGSNKGGAMTGFMGMGMGMQAGGNFLDAASRTNVRQMQAQQTAPTVLPAASDAWTCSCGAANTGKFCSECGSPKPASSEWTCSCGTVNKGKFCSECGSPKPASSEWTCSCGTINNGKFCQNCGKKHT